MQGRGFYIAAGGGSAYQSFTHIKTAIEDGRFNAKLVNLSNDICLLSVQGPRRYIQRRVLHYHFVYFDLFINSRDLFEKLCARSRFSNEAFPFSTHQIVNVGGHDCRAMRISFVGEMGNKIICLF